MLPIYDLCCEIEYCNANGEVTARMVTMSAVREGAEVPLIYAFCHLREAVRSFRVDRITRVITLDGEVFDGEHFIRKVLRIDFVPGAAVVRNPAGIARRHIGQPLSLLVAAARCDGHYHPEEMDIIMTHAEREYELLHARGLVHDPMTIEIADGLAAMIRTMRPQARSLATYLVATLDAEEEALARFRRSLLRVVLADGEVAPLERSFLEDLDILRAQSAAQRLITISEAVPGVDFFADLGALSQRFAAY